MLPRPVATRIDFSALALRAGSFVDEKLAGSHSDLLFSAAIGGRSALIYLLFEHQSSEATLMAFRLLHREARPGTANGLDGWTLQGGRY